LCVSGVEGGDVGEKGAGGVCDVFDESGATKAFDENVVVWMGVRGMVEVSEGNERATDGARSLQHPGAPFLVRLPPSAWTLGRLGCERAGRA
jgi:hypothetical protein